MATINAESISGFDTMSAEEKVNALLGYEFDDGADKLKAAEDNAAKLKAAMDKAASEAAGYKKQLNARLSDEERTKQESEAAMKAMQDELAALKQEKRLSDAKTMFLGGGFDEATAADAATAFVESDSEKMSAALKKFREAIVTQTKSALMDASPKPDSASQDDADGKDDATKLAESLGKLRAEQAKRSADILNQYTRRGKE